MPNVRKQQQASQWLAKLGESVYAYASQCAQQSESGAQNRDREAMEVLLHLKEVAGPSLFFENMEWSNLSMTVAERVLASVAGAGASTGQQSTLDRIEDAQPKLIPLRFLYDVYLAYYQQDPQCLFREDFIRVRTDLAKCYFTLGEHGHLESILRKHKELNTAPLWRILVNAQTTFGWKKEAAKSCVLMAQFAETSGMAALATTAREEAFALDPNIKPDGTEFASATFMTKEELREATREEIVGSFLSDPHNQHNYEHLVDFLEDEGSIVNAVRVIVAHSLTKNVPAQYQAATALPLRRLVSLVAHLQSKYIPQLQLLSTEANNLRQTAGQEPLSTPDLAYLLSQAQREEEYRTTTVSILEMIAKKIAPPKISGSIPVPSNLTSSSSPSVLGHSSLPSSPASSSSALLSSSPPVSAVDASSAMAQQRAVQRSSWGIKPGQGKDRNKRFTMGIKTPGALGSSGGFGSRSDYLASPGPASSSPALSGLGVSAPPSSPSAAKTPGPGRPPANFAWGPGAGPIRIGGPPTSVENPIFSQPLVPPHRLHTPSTLTPFAPMADPNATGDGASPLEQSAFAVDDSPFSTTVFNGMPDQLSPISPRKASEEAPPPPAPEEDTPPPAPADTFDAGPFSAHPEISRSGNVGDGANSITSNTSSTSNTGYVSILEQPYAQPNNLGGSQLLGQPIALTTSSHSLNGSNASVGSSSTQSLTASLGIPTTIGGGTNTLGFVSSASQGSLHSGLLPSSVSLTLPQTASPLLGNTTTPLGTTPSPLLGATPLLTGSSSSLLGASSPSLLAPSPLLSLTPNTAAPTGLPQATPLGTTLLAGNSTVTTTTPPPRMQSPLTGPSLSTFNMQGFGATSPGYTGSYAFGNPALSNPAVAQNPALASGLLPPASLASPYNSTTPPPAMATQAWNPTGQNPPAY
jgi:hypothetical protein